MKKLKPTLWLSFAMASVTLALALIAYTLGLMPDGYKAELESRAKVAESLAVQLAGAASRDDKTVLQETLRSMVTRNDDVYSVALRHRTGALIMSAGDHEEKWVPLSDGKSTPTHVSVPLIGAKGKQGDIEISFAPASSSTRVLGIPTSLFLFLGFLTTAGFSGYFFMLRRSLRELDPGRVIPERVQKAFDTLSEGVIIVDEHECILLMNRAFAKFYGGSELPKLGSKINTLSWRMVDGSEQAGGYPWHTALREGREMREDLLSLRTSKGEIHNFNVNATVITGEKDKTIGAIVTLSDTTSLKRSTEDLEKATDLLEKSKEQVSRQSKELAYLANHDTLTGCMNRRAFFAQLTKLMETDDEYAKPLSTMIIDLDHFKQTNDNFGPAAADRLLIGIAELLRAEIGNENFVARYDGDQFCVALTEHDITAAEKMATQIRQRVAETSHDLLPGGSRVTISIGIARKPEEACTPQELVLRSDQALQAAKRKGRDTFEHWGESLSDLPLSPEGEIINTTAAPSPLAVEPSQAAPALVPHAEAIALQRKMSTDELVQMAADSANQAFFEGIDKNIERAEASNKPYAVMRLSVETWEYLGEALGTEFCRRLMRSVKARVSESLREHDSVFILGDSGDILMELTDPEGVGDVTWIVNRVLEELKEPLEIGGKKTFVSCKAGLAVFPDDGRDAKTLVRNAGVALRRALLNDRLAGYVSYNSEMTQSSVERLNLEAGIRHALQNDGFELFFQPIIDAKTKKLTAAEALLRCGNTELLNVPMDKVISVAEKSSLSSEIDNWVLNAAIKQMSQWCNAGINLPKLTINISANQLSNVALMDRVFETIKKVPFSPARLQLEVTETAAVADVEIAAPQLKRLQQLGVQIALDDFGTGQASMTYLQRLHPDIVKIDRSFVNGVNTNHANATLVSAMTVMSHCLGLKVTVEGVETEEQLEFVKEIGCDEVQGYLISKPMPVSIMTDWMKLYMDENGASEYAERKKRENTLDRLERRTSKAA